MNIVKKITRKKIVNILFYIFISIVIGRIILGQILGRLEQRYVIGTFDRANKKGKGGVVYCKYRIYSKEYEAGSTGYNPLIHKKGTRLYIEVPKDFPAFSMTYEKYVVPDYIKVVPPEQGWTLEEFKKIDPNFKIEDQ